MRPHLATVVSLMLLVVNGFVTTRFVGLMNHQLARQADQSIRLPPSPGSRAVEVRDLTLTLDPEGIHLDGRLLPMENLLAIVRSRSPRSVGLRIESTVAYSKLKPVLIELNKVGVGNVRVTVVQKP